ncbi:bifunctional 3-(3-hydroxy-phenyl)propionate/3-hydroxycinnamic acid hydroxylase MhpA [Nocardia goodfellowii]
MAPQRRGMHDVVVVGAGPVGLATARMLGMRGYDVLVLERQSRPYPLPRAVHFDAEIGRVFQAMGLAEEIRAISEPVPDHYEWRNRAGAALVRIDWSGVGPSGWPTASFFSQPELEQVLAQAVTAMPEVTLRRGAKVVGIEEHDDYVVLSLADGDASRARFVIGCDGANSLVREHLETEMCDLGFFFDWLIIDTIPLDDQQWSPQNWQLCDPARPTTIVSGGPGRRRWEFMRLPAESRETLDTAETAWRLLEPWGRTPENTELERHCVYTFSARWAQRWQRGRLAIAGDAAHLMPPFAGQGMCSGLRDAANLTWKLDRVLRGESDAGLLDTYTVERRTHLQHAITMSVELGRVICVLDEAEAAARDARMIAGGADPAVVLPSTALPVLGTGVTASTMDRAGLRGTLAPQYPVVHEGRSVLLDAVVGRRAALLIGSAGSANMLGATLNSQLSAIEVSPFTIHGGGTADLADHTGQWTEWFAATGMHAVLVRPDRYIFGAVTEADRLASLLDQYRQCLRPTA